jgi:hypothetical protein
MPLGWFFGVLPQQDSASPMQPAQQLSAEAAANLDVLTRYAAEEQRHRRSFSYDTVWLLVRPVLRAVLWLLPQHVLTAAHGTGTSSSSNSTGVHHVTAVATVSGLCLQVMTQELCCLHQTATVWEPCAALYPVC